MRNASSSLMIVLVAIVLSPACSSPPASPFLEPLWRLDVGPSGASIRSAGSAADSVVVSVPTGSSALLAYVEQGALAWSKEIPSASDLAVSPNGRIHYLDNIRNSEVHRIEPSGTELSSLTVGPEPAQLVAAHDTAAIVVQSVAIGMTGVRVPRVVSVSAASTVNWERTIDIGGRCLFAGVLRERNGVLVVGGLDGENVNNGCASSVESRIWLAAISASDGSLLWSQVASPTGAISDIAIGDDLIVATGDFGTLAVDADGNERWSALEASYRTGIEIVSPDYLVIVEFARVYLMNAIDGTESGDFVEVREAQDGRVFFDGADTLYVAGARRRDGQSRQPAVAALRVNVPDE